MVEAAHYGYGVPNRPTTWGFHTPEEPADSYPSTPDYLAVTDRDASYNYFVSYLAFVFQLVPESEGAYAHGLDGKPAPFWSDGTNLNLQSLSVSFEGYAATIHQTMPRGSPQWNAGVDLVAHRTKALGLNLDWAIQHEDVSIYRSDCGQWDQAAFIADVKAKMEGDMGMTQAEQEAFDVLQSQVAGLITIHQEIEVAAGHHGPGGMTATEKANHRITVGQVGGLITIHQEIETEPGKHGGGGGQHDHPLPAKTGLSG